MATDPVVTSLARSKLFQGIDSPRLESIRGRGRILTVALSELVVEEGQPSTSLYVIVDGELEVFLPTTSDRFTRVGIATLGPGDCIGEYAFIDDEPASASVAATRPTQLFTMAKIDFQLLLESDPAIGRIVYRNLLLLLVTRLREGNRQLDLFRPTSASR